MIYDREKLIADLKQSVVEVTFTKVNGERRIMRCTLDIKQLPPMTNEQYNHLDGQQKREENKEIIAVWDVQANGWRSFRVDSVQYVQEVAAY
jgi:WYL_2, Sm-like SH3 beta-barrel fold